MTTIVSSVSQGEHDVSMTEGVGFNGEWLSGSLHLGFHKSGTKLHPYLKFGGMTIPKNSTITAASIEVNVQGEVVAGTVTANISTLAKDGLWNPAGPVGPQWNKTAGDDNWRVHLKDGASTTIAEVGLVTQANAGSTLLTGDGGARIQRWAQVVICGAAGSIDRARVALGGSMFVGTPTGTVWVELWSISGAGVPDTLLATSATIDVSTIAPKLWAELRPEYEFTFGSPLAVAFGQFVAVVLRGDITSGTGPHLGNWRWNYPFGQLSAYGSGVGFDEVNYVTYQDDLAAIPTIGAPVVWATPVTVGVKTTPSLVAMVQNWIDDAGYTGDVDGFIAFVFRTISGTASVLGILSSFEAAGANAKLTVTFTPPVAARRRVRISS